MRVVTTKPLWPAAPAFAAERLAYVQAPHFTAGVVIRGDRVTEAAPILAWAVGKCWLSVFDYFVRKGYKVRVTRSRQ